MIAAPPTAPDKLWLPTLQKEIPRPWFIPDEATLAEQKRIMESSYFLLRIKGNAGIGEALVCDPRKGGCGGKHDFWTLRCVPMPFSGITGGLYAYFRAVKDNGLADGLSPSERARYDAVTNALGDLPDISASHPRLARSLTRGLSSGDAQIAAVALGLCEPVPVTLARTYARRINDRGVRPRFTLPGPAGQGA